MPETKIRFQRRHDLIPFTRNDWLLYVSAHALALVNAFPDDRWKLYLLPHPNEQQQLLTPEELIFQRQKDIVELGGFSSNLAHIVSDVDDSKRLSIVHDLLYKELRILFPNDMLNRTRTPRFPDDFREYYER